MMQLKFKCAQCDGSVIEEVVIDGVIFQDVEVNDDGSYHCVGESHVIEGRVEMYQCNHCG